MTAGTRPGNRDTGTIPERSTSASGKSPSAADWLKLLRPKQWLKNGFVLTPLLFSGRMMDPAAVAAALGAFTTFCLLASGVYIWNDIVDRQADREHPTKRLRPIASGRLSVNAGVAGAIFLTTIALAGAWFLNPKFFIVALAYLGLNLLYSIILKAVVLLDVFALASFFLLRLIAGAAVLEAKATVWLLLCGGLLALYLGFAKRRHELLLLGSEAARHRSVLTEYSPQLLDQMSTVLLSATVISYVMYTLSSETAAAVGSEMLSYSSIFVLYGAFRYLYLTHRGEGGNPSELLISDRALLIDIVLWTVYCGWVLYRPS